MYAIATIHILNAQVLQGVVLHSQQDTTESRQQVHGTFTEAVAVRTALDAQRARATLGEQGTFVTSKIGYACLLVHHTRL